MASPQVKTLTERIYCCNWLTHPLLEPRPADMKDSVLRPLNSDPPLTELELQGFTIQKNQVWIQFSVKMLWNNHFNHFYVKADHFSRLNLYPKLLTNLLYFFRWIDFSECEEAHRARDGRHDWTAKWAKEGGGAHQARDDRHDEPRPCRDAHASTGIISYCMLKVGAAFPMVLVRHGLEFVNLEPLPRVALFQERRFGNPCNEWHIRLFPNSLLMAYATTIPALNRAF